MCNSWLRHSCCWDLTQDLDAIFPPLESSYSLDVYLDMFFNDLSRWPGVTETFISSVAYCRTRGPTGYPFLLVRLLHPKYPALPILLKLQGTEGAPPEIPRYPWLMTEASAFTFAGMYQTARRLVGARYDEYHAMTFPLLPHALPLSYGCPRSHPSIVDLLVLTDLATEHDPTCAGFTATFFMALKTLFNGIVISSVKRHATAMYLSRDLKEDTKSAVVDAFPARREHMQEQIALRRRGPSTAYYSKLREEISKTSRDLKAALAQVAILEEKIVRLTES
ncbi:hypothetical protein DFH09DRAFT_1156090 [Mycena vulgaris]|nr:hypothetical protein DFH09DRAFT_1156090 [Mycena vulgaris]